MSFSNLESVYIDSVESKQYQPRAKYCTISSSWALISTAHIIRTLSFVPNGSSLLEKLSEGHLLPTLLVLGAAENKYTCTIEVVAVSGDQLRLT